MITLRVEIDGKPATLRMTPWAARALAVIPLTQAAPLTPATEPPIEGYAALSAKLKEVGINRHPKTLERWCVAGRLPCRRFSKRVRFYLSEVLDTIGGRR